VDQYQLFLKNKEIIQLFFFRGGDDLLHYFYLGGNGAWAHDGTTFKEGGRVDGDIKSVYNKEQKHANVMFMGENGHQVYYYIKDDAWHCDKSSFDKHKCNGRIAICFSEQRKHVETYCECGECGSYYYLGENGSWSNDDTTFKH